MRRYIERHLFGVGVAVVVMVGLSLGWPVHDGVTQADDAANSAILTVSTCIEADARVDRFEEALVEEDIIEEDLLRTKVTNGMCEDMLAPVPEGTTMQRLAAAQNYMQEIELIEGAMKVAAGQASMTGPDRYSSSVESMNPFRTIAHTSEQTPALAQYDEPGGIEPRVRQAAAAANAGEDADASIPDRLDQKEAALKEGGAGAREAAAGGRCSLEVEVPDEEWGKSSGLYEISPHMPNKMQHRETERAGLLVSPATEEKLREIGRKHEAIAEASEFDTGCVDLTDQMKAQIVPGDLDELAIDPHQFDDVRELSSSRNTMWGWDITARQKGELDLRLDLRFAISREDQEFRLIPGSPIYDGEIEVTPQGDSTQNGTQHKATEQPWWRRILQGIINGVSGHFGA